MFHRCRLANRTDLPALLELERSFPGDRLSRRSFEHLLNGAHADVWVCAAGERVIADAVVLYRRGTRSARLYSIVVAHEARGSGVASALLRTLEATARRRGCERVSLEVRTDNRAALALYEKRGYRVVRRIAGFYEDGQDALRLERVLGQTVRLSSRREAA
ncbi:MAG: GNAT family N-acetyltransferase [Sulfurifustis sp.]